jgi:hypothetical protein
MTSGLDDADKALVDASAPTVQPAASHTNPDDERTAQANTAARQRPQGYKTP